MLAVGGLPWLVSPKVECGLPGRPRCAAKQPARPARARTKGQSPCSGHPRRRGRREVTSGSRAGDWRGRHEHGMMKAPRKEEGAATHRVSGATMVAAAMEWPCSTRPTRGRCGVALIGRKKAWGELSPKRGHDSAATVKVGEVGVSSVNGGGAGGSYSTGWDTGRWRVKKNWRRSTVGWHSPRDREQRLHGDFRWWATISSDGHGQEVAWGSEGDVVELHLATFARMREGEGEGGRCGTDGFE
jgi:hypothetical protein